MRILIAEKNRSFRAEFVELITHCHPTWQIVQTADVVEFRTRMNGSHFDVVFLDLLLPGLQAYVALATLRTDYPHTKIIGLGDTNDSASIIRCFEDGLGGYISRSCSGINLIRTLKASPGRYNFGSSGIGTYPHLSAEMFKWRAGGLFVVHIPYRGTGLVVTDLIAGQITFLMDSIVSAQTHIKDGRVRALAVTGAQRSGSLPDVPTFTELGVPGLAFSNWFGFFAPAGTPADVVQRANRELNTLMRAPDVADRLRQLGADPVTGTPEAFAKVIRDEHDGWKAVIQRAGIKAE